MMDKWLIVINYLAQKVDDLYQTKLYKLLFYIDFFHYRKIEKSITWSFYYKLPLWPVPLEIKSIIDCMNDAEREDKSIDKDISSYKEYLDIIEKDGNKKMIKSIKQIDILKHLTDSEIESVDFIIERLWNKKSNDIVEISHKEPIYINADMFEPLLYGYANTLLAV